MPALASAIVIIATLAASFLFLREEPSPENARRAGAARLMNDLMSGKVPVGGTFTLTDQHGRSTGLADFRGKLVLLYFGFMSCPDICPTDLLAIGQAIQLLGAEGDRLQPVLITLDPERDEGKALGAYAASFHPMFVALTGSESQIRRVASDYKVFYEKVRVPRASTYTIDHTAFTFLLDRDGKYIGLFPPGTPPERMTAILREHLRAL